MTYQDLYDAAVETLGSADEAEFLRLASAILPGHAGLAAWAAEAGLPPPDGKAAFLRRLARQLLGLARDSEVVETIAMSGSLMAEYKALYGESADHDWGVDSDAVMKDLYTLLRT